jgi:hypothetical protein
LSARRKNAVSNAKYPAFVSSALFAFIILCASPTAAC